VAGGASVSASLFHLPRGPLGALECLASGWGTFVEVWEHNRAGEPVYHNAWFTDLEVDEDNVRTVIWMGRSRWKIENEQFHVHKNHGYELEHNSGHGQQTLSMVF